MDGLDLSRPKYQALISVSVFFELIWYFKSMNKKNLSVDEFTTTCPVTAGPDDFLGEVLAAMKLANIRHMPVTSTGQVVGLVSHRDATGDNEQTLVGEVMKTEVYTVSKDDMIHDVAFEMSARKIGSAVVVDENEELYGIFTTTDALNALVEVVRGVFDNE